MTENLRAPSWAQGDTRTPLIEQTLDALFERDFDVVLCDAPPLLPVTDAAILARSTSGAILVASAGKVTRHQLEGAVERRQRRGDVFVGQPVKTVAAHAFSRNCTRQCEELCNRRLAAMESGIEAGHLRHATQRRCKRFNRRQIVRLMQGRKRDQ